ncbi:hypothetical protein BDK51DRAFT_53053 [Blyttiomyces helicus]|uniref:Uncharacterized protein n=1 Tax=Blyttiomyces helicus TaxID=388810 RepID=A0A4P9VZZ5_9FUNG|nr:hypothetical protein BDK51DRAFT_53053 [Blyttiomyces helicus]|eukprot:RKO85409.1 hypothetical protein BDK51DRAFT_53053 [Blyttiomyces helicus]
MELCKLLAVCLSLAATAAASATSGSLTVQANNTILQNIAALATSSNGKSYTVQTIVSAISIRGVVSGAEFVPLGSEGGSFFLPVDSPAVGPVLLNYNSTALALASLISCRWASDLRELFTSGGLIIIFLPEPSQTPLPAPRSHPFTDHQTKTLINASVLPAKSWIPTMLAGAAIEVGSSQGGGFYLKFNGGNATVVDSIPCANGMIYVISNVLVPPPKLTDFISPVNGLTVLYGTIAEAGAMPLLGALSNFTL